MGNNFGKKKKLYLLTDGFPYGKGEKSFIMPELDVLKEKFDIVIISTAWPKVARQKELVTKLDDSIKVYRFSTFEQGILMYAIRLLLFWLKKECWMEIADIVKKREKIISRIWDSMLFFAKAEGLYRWMEKKHIIRRDDDGIYYTYWYNYKALAMTMYRKRYPKLKIIARTHRYDLFDEQVPITGRQPFKRVMDAKLDKVVFISKQGYQYYLDNMDKKPCSKYVISKLGSLPAPKTLCQKRSDKFRIVSCSHLNPVKRVDLIIDSLSLICDIDIEWTHFGDGTERTYIEKCASNKLESKENISYQLKGHLQNDKIYEFYEKNYVDCFITLSASEGLPVSIMEAISFGIPIIATDVGGNSELLDGNGYLLGANPSPKEAADKIKHMARLDSEAYKVMRDASRRIWENEYNAVENARRFTEFLADI